MIPRSFIVTACALGALGAATAQPASWKDGPVALAGVTRVPAGALDQTWSGLLAEASHMDVLDADGDGDLDVVQGYPGLGVFLAENTGGGAFVAQALDPLGGLYFGAPVTAGDFDGDGDDDVFVGLVTPGGPGAAPTGGLRLLRNDGLGNFAAAGDLPLPATIVRLVSADLDQDGVDDAIAAASMSHDVFVAYGNGAVATFPLAVPADGLVVVDLNQDGYPDVASAPECAGAAIGGVLNDGAGALTGPAFQASLDGASLSALAFLDDDQDGDLDLLTLRAATTGTSLLRMENTGGNHFVASTEVPVANYWLFGRTLEVADLDGDDRLDAVLLTRTPTPTVTAFHGDGAGGYTIAGGISVYAEDLRVAPLVDGGLPSIVTADAKILPLSDGGRIGGVRVPTPTAGIRLVAIVDLDADGVDDVAAVNPFAAKVELYRSDGERGFVAAGSFPVPFAQTVELLAADLDGDGDRDLVAQGPTQVSGMLFGPGGPISSQVTTLPMMTGFRHAVGDVNGDGRDDVVMTHKYTDDVVTALSNGDGSFTMATAKVGGVPESLRLADLDGDGRDDLVYGDRAWGGVQTNRSNGDGSYQPPVVLPAADTGLRVACGDLDGDGDLDVVAAVDAARVQVLRNDGHGGLTAEASIGTALPYLHQLELLDLDGDGALDVLAVNSSSSQLGQVLTGSGAGFTPGPIVELAAIGGCAVFRLLGGDLDGDGLPDVVVNTHEVTSTVSTAYVLFNDSQLRAEGVLESGRDLELQLRAADCAGMPYLLLASTLGGVPGLDLGADHLTINPDPSLLPITLAGGKVFQGFVGVLDVAGRATARVSVPTSLAIPAGLGLHFAFVTVAPKGSPLASNAVHCVTR